MEPQCSVWRVPHLPHFSDGGAYFVERGTQGRIQSLAGGGEMNAPRRAPYQGDPQPLLEPPHGLTDSGMRDSKAIGSRTKTLCFRDRHKCRHPIQLICHW